MKKYSREHHASLAVWSADCAERVLPFFEVARPGDDRPRQAIADCRDWVRTGVFSMARIRGASLASHAAARDATGNEPAALAARAAGQAVATAHVPQHAFGGAYYALKAIAAAYPVDGRDRIVEEFEWQLQRVPADLRPEVIARVIVTRSGTKIRITINKDGDF